MVRFRIKTNGGLIIYVQGDKTHNNSDINTALPSDEHRTHESSLISPEPVLSKEGSYVSRNRLVCAEDFYMSNSCGESAHDYGRQGPEFLTLPEQKLIRPLSILRQHHRMKSMTRASQQESTKKNNPQIKNTKNS